MIIKILLVCALSLSFAWAQNSAEEAIILNQELQFLEDSIQNVEILSSNKVIRSNEQNLGEKLSLEEQYFGDGEDNVSTRAAAPKRRQN